ncbi:unnamed protein product [Caenorhabditis bovis]|uniref:Nucleoporin Nup133/Nup155-like N-terminal domain-containing protein n=1 Tax=Caenorhabditis bovis TaxID=2654633 RepID=A0A8S1EKS7_9PELO|nr:unnamed protein product [Caenorhabditis bovis]
MSSAELELCLDGVPIEFPAIVKEAILASKDEIFPNCASLNEKYCWYLTKSQLFIWERLVSGTNRTHIPMQLALPLSGLHLSTKTVVVYDGAQRSKGRSSTTGVLIVSPEGVLRHWNSVHSQSYAECVLDLGNEVILSVELVDPPTEDKPASFILVTTSGSVFYLRANPECPNSGMLAPYKIASRDTSSIRRRLSSIMFGGNNREMSLVSRSFLFWEKRSQQPFVACVYPDALTVFDIAEKRELWTVKSKHLFEPVISNYIESEIEERSINVTCRLIDASYFRNGIMILVAATHDKSQFISLYLTFIGKDWMETEPTDAVWTARVPMPEQRALFLKSNEGIYTKLELRIPSRSAEAMKSERTDGIIIINQFFIQSIYVPDDLENATIWDLTLCKTANLPPLDILLGSALCAQYCYILMLDSGVFTIRLLPRGFSDSLNGSFYTNEQSSSNSLEDWAALSCLLSEMVASGLPKTAPIQSFHKALDLFGEKDMVLSSAEIQNIRKMSDVEIAELVQQFLRAVIDYTDEANKVDAELHAKKVITSRTLLFLRHMDLFDRVANAKIPYDSADPNVMNEYRSGLSMLAEMNERVAAAAALWHWRGLHESNAEVFDAVFDAAVKNVVEAQNLGINNRETFFARLGLLHYIPREAFNQLMIAINKGKSQKYEVFHSIADMFIVIKMGISSLRRCKCAIEKKSGWWTFHTITTYYKKLCEKICEELKTNMCSECERSRLLAYVLNLYDFYLGEIDTQPDDDKILMDIILFGRVSEGMLLAEKHRDFGVLVKMALRSDKDTRQKSLNRFKKVFDYDDFEMYLCQFLKKHGRNDILLEQKGQRVDEYLDNFKELRYSREISNKQYAKAAYTLMSLAEAETKSFERFADFLSRAHACARAAEPGEPGVDDVLNFYKKRLPELKHRRAIPIDVIRSGYGDDLDVMMSIDEMLEWNMVECSTDEKTIEGYLRALHLLSDLKRVEDSADLQKRIDTLWKRLIEIEEWPRIKNRDEAEKKTVFGRLCTELVEYHPKLNGSSTSVWSIEDRLLVAPRNFDELLDSSQIDKKCKPWVKAHLKWVIERLEKRAKHGRTPFFLIDMENVGSLTTAALDGFAPILEIRKRKWTDEAMN